MITNAMAAAIGGMNAQGTRFLHIGNSIANSSTTGFKTGDTIFAETLTYASGRSPSGHRVQPGGGVTILGTEYDFSEGQLLDDEDEFHLGIQGNGFFPVTIGGLDYVTRAGDFSLVPNPGALPAAGGFVMMRANGAMLQGSATPGGAIVGGSAGILHFDSAPTSVDIGSDGTLDILPLSVVVTNGNIGYKNYINTDALVREDGQLFLESPLASPVDTVNLIVPGTGNTGFLRQKTLEQSNVDLTNEFTKMIVAQRNFQANAKTITTADEMLNVSINVKR